MNKISVSNDGRGSHLSFEAQIPSTIRVDAWAYGASEEEAKENLKVELRKLKETIDELLVS